MSLTEPLDGDRVIVPVGQLTELLAAVKQSNKQIQQLKEEIVKSKDEAKEAITKRLKRGSSISNRTGTRCSTRRMKRFWTSWKQLYLA